MGQNCLLLLPGTAGTFSHAWEFSPPPPVCDFLLYHLHLPTSMLGAPAACHLHSMPPTTHFTDFHKPSQAYLAGFPWNLQTYLPPLHHAFPLPTTDSCLPGITHIAPITLCLLRSTTPAGRMDYMPDIWKRHHVYFPGGRVGGVDLVLPVPACRQPHATTWPQDLYHRHALLTAYLGLHPGCLPPAHTPIHTTCLPALLYALVCRFIWPCPAPHTRGPMPCICAYMSVCLRCHFCMSNSPHAPWQLPPADMP